MRLFISCEIPKNIADYVHSLSEQLPKKAKYIIPHNIDLTIKFLGDTPEEKVDEVKQCLSQLKFKSFRAMLNGSGVFTEDFIRVVWAGLTPSEKFEELHKQVDDILAPIFPKEKRFQSHLTIARVKYVEEKEAFLKEIKNLKVEPKTFDVNKLILFQSKLSPKGATHTPLLEIMAMRRAPKPL